MVNGSHISSHCHSGNHLTCNLIKTVWKKCGCRCHQKKPTADKRFDREIKSNSYIKKVL